MSDPLETNGHPAKEVVTAPYSGRNQIPTVRGYQALKEERERETERPPSLYSEHGSSPKSIKSKRRSILSSAKGLLRTGSLRHVSSSSQKGPDPPKADGLVPGGDPSHLDQRRSDVEDSQVPSGHIGDTVSKDELSKQPGLSAESETATASDDHSPGLTADADDAPHENVDQAPHQSSAKEEAPMKDTSEAVAGSSDPREQRKLMKKKDRGVEGSGREVTDPITHLPIKIHDPTDEDLDNTEENLPAPDAVTRSATGLAAKKKSPSMLEDERKEQQDKHEDMASVFPPPDFDQAKADIASICARTLLIGILVVLAIPSLLLILAQLSSVGLEVTRNWKKLVLGTAILLVTGIIPGLVVIYILRGWLDNRLRAIWSEHVWDAARQQERQLSNRRKPESVLWLNSLLSSLWGIINPDLFTSLMDTIEDVMQASLPKLVRMVSVEDMGQGNESLRILAIRWLPTGAAAKSLLQDGEAKTDNEEGDLPDAMDAEEGDFVNIEVAFSYRASTSSKKLNRKTNNAHLFLAFFLPGGVKFPVWCELKGMVGTMRLRLQLNPDPPFFAVCTLTFLGQPKVDLSCIPLTKKGLNIMDLPLISNFVQSSIDAALAGYVAPKSLTLDLKSMLAGDDFKKDVDAHGVLVVKIKQGRDFKAGDPGLLGIGEGSSDPYVAVGWAKFGKVIWSTRIIMTEMQPVWEETAFILVTPEELNAKERLRIQLWDSDRGSADDDLGRIEVDLEEIMHSPDSKGKMKDRTDGFQALDDHDKMPGTLDWSVGYFTKTRIQESQIQTQKVEPDIHNIAELKEQVSKDAKRKLREATDRDETSESEQQEVQDLKEREDAMIASTPPLHDFPSGILAIQIHQITGIEYEDLSKDQDPNESDEEGSGDLPSSYCTIIMNHQSIFRTRTKPKNAKPFFNAGTERFLKDYRSTEVIIAVRDSRVHENDALLGLIYLPLATIFKNRSQLTENFPIVGGIGHGRAKVSLLFRSAEVNLPAISMGWDFGTVEITKSATSTDASDDIKGLKMKLRTSISRAKMYVENGADSHTISWKGKRDTPSYLAVRKRYCSCLIIEFKKNNVGIDKRVGFGVLWLKDVPDNQEVEVDVPILRFEDDRMKRLATNVIHEAAELGTVRLSLTFRHGLGPYHEKLIAKNPSMKGVFEVLRTAHESKEVKFTVDKGSESDSSSSSESSDDEDDKSVNDGKGGPLKQLKNYKQHSDQLHRQHRGVMQWKGARTADYLKTKAEHSKYHLLDRFKHHEREPGIETEV